MNLFNKKIANILFLGIILLVFSSLFSQKKSRHSHAKNVYTSTVNEYTTGNQGDARSIAAETSKSPTQNKTAFSLQEERKIQSTPNRKQKTYLSLQDGGIIGFYDGRTSDDPSDNIFTVLINEDLSLNDKVSLCYRLTGVEDQSNVSFSINDNPAYGGCLIKSTNNTSHQRIEINPAWLEKGANRIQFSISESMKYGYQIEDLMIVIEDANDFPVAINTGEWLYNNQAYVHGFIKSRKHVQLLLDGKSIKIKEDGAFETVLDNVQNNKITLSATIGGKTYTKSVLFKGNKTPDKEYALISSYSKTVKTFETGKADIIKTNNAFLTISDSSLLRAKELSVMNLRSIDLPAMDYGLTNVTANGEGIRFLPHGIHFKEGASVAIKYDRTKIPSGYTEEDIKTFYFDNATMHWVPLEKDSIDKDLCMVVSKTTHFTDMINGVIQIPESPETTGFTPTIMSDIKVADPTTGVQLVTPPTANNNGTANLSYQIELPPARHGISPNLTIQYNSDAKSGWLGEGWDLNIPAITVDTRWGVPRYDNHFETETYIMNGTMLATIVDNGPQAGDSLGDVSVAHTGVLYPRNSDGGKQFYIKAGHDFSKIIRKNNSTGNYYWEVWDKDGTKYIYGDPTNSDRAVLKDNVQTFSYSSASGGNKIQVTKDAIAEWKLSRVINLYGDYCEYVYEKVNEPIKENILSGKAIYLQEIRIGRNDTIYQTIRFVGQSQKTKKENNARYGFFTSSNRLLENITVHLESTKVREYSFNYEDGPFSIKLLKNIIQKDDSGNNFTHDFAYHNEIDNEQNIFSESKKSTSLEILLPTLGGGSSTSKGGSFYAGLGIGFKWLGGTVGWSHTSSSTESEKKLMLVDIDGDGLPDKLFNENKTLFYFKNTGNGAFSTKPVALGGYNGKLAYSESKTTSNGWQGEVTIAKKVNVNAGMDKGKTFVKNPMYLLDVNNDGLIDIVDNGKVYFNTLDRTESITPSFTKNSFYTDNPIYGGQTYLGTGVDVGAENLHSTMNNGGINKVKAAAGMTQYTDTQPLERDTAYVNAEKRELFANSPMQDIVRVWEAPYDGEIEIHSFAEYIATEGSNPTEGCRIAIQKGAEELYSSKLSKDESSVYSMEDIQIAAGERVYFRLQSGDEEFSDGTMEMVKWQPKITYTNFSESGEDFNELSSDVYVPEDSRFINKIGYNLVDSCSDVSIKGYFYKPVTSDSIQLNVYLSNDAVLFKDSVVTELAFDSITQTLDTVITNYYVEYDNPIYQEKALIKQFTFLANDTSDGNLNFQVKNLDNINHYWFEIASESNVCWDKIKWFPEICYNRNGKDTIVYAGVKYDIYAKKLTNGAWFTSSDSGADSVNITPNFVFSSNDVINSDYTIKIWDSNKNLLRRANGAISNNVASSVKISKLPSTEIFMEMFIHDTINTPFSSNVTIGSNSYSARTFCKRKTDDYEMGVMWRGWGQFEYNAANGRYALPILEDRLFIPQDTNQLKLENMAMIRMNPDFDRKTHWRGLNDNMFIKDDTICCGRLNIADMPNIALYSAPGGPMAAPVNPNQNYENCMINNAPVLSSTHETETYWGGAGVNIGSISGNTSLSKSSSKGYTTMAFMDLNGDGYPDRITDNRIEYSNARGGTDGERLNQMDRPSTRSSSFATGFTGATAKSLSGELTPIVANNLTAAIIDGNLLSAYTNSDYTANAYLDVNGDGLPDRLYVDGNSIKVCFNKGYSFTTGVEWGLQQIQSGVNSGLNYSAGLLNKNDLLKGLKTVEAVSNKISMFDFGVSINSAISTNKTLYEITDINGDGLADLVYLDEKTNEVSVRYNLGNSFSSALKLSNIKRISSQVSAAIGANINAKISIRIFWLFKIVLGGGLNYGTSIDYLLSDIRDINGDGYPDFLDADILPFDLGKLNSMNVRLSKIGVTNKLKSVTNPFNGKFTIDYARSKPTSNHPGGKWVMQAITLDDGMEIIAKNTFEYDGGKYDRLHREFIGFGQVTTNNIDVYAQKKPVYRSTVHEYDNTNYYQKGNLLSITLLNGESEKNGVSSNQYYVYSVNRNTKSQHKGYVLQEEPMLNDDKIKRSEFIIYSPVKYNRNDRYEYDGGVSSRTTTSESFSEYYLSNGYHGELKSYTYSDRGNLRDNGSGPYNYKTTIDYMNKIVYAPNTSELKHYITGLPVKVVVQDSKTKYRQTFAEWNDANNPAKITQIRNDLDTSAVAVTDITYDAWGNILTKTLPKNKNNQRLKYTYEYDNRYHMYPVRITDSYGYSSSMDAYNYIYGVPTQITDINGNIQTTELDGLGRMTKIKSPKEADYTIRFEYNTTVSKNNNGKTTAPAYAVTKHYNPDYPNDPIRTVTFTGGFGRPVQVKKDAVVDGLHKMVVSGKIKYDAFGRIIESYYPHADEPGNGTALFAYGTEDTPPTRTEYDVQDRIIKTTLPDGSISINRYSISEGLLKTLITDALDNKQAVYSNGSGLTVKTEQYPDENETLTTLYMYDGINQLRAVTDAMGKSSISEYDRGGRRTRYYHPAAGTTRFMYDEAGNITEKQTANLSSANMIVAYDYEYNRIKSVNYPEHPENNVNYTYGDNNASDNGKGRLVLLEDGSGAQEYKYGNMGELTEVRRTLIIPDQAIATYLTKWEYDSWNRIRKMTYPDGEEVNYRYDRGGQLATIKGTTDYIREITYDKFEQRTSVTLGNGAKTDYTYAPKTRYLKTLDVHAGGKNIMENTYGYDPVGNILNVTNSASPSINPATGAGIGGGMVHSYAYDKLYRLSSASGEFAGGSGKSASYTLDMQYDRMHNIISKKQHIEQTNVQFDGTLHAGYELAYTYNPDNAQQISEIRDMNYRGEVNDSVVQQQRYMYDANGNLLYLHTSTAPPAAQGENGGLERRLLWDEENRLLAISDNGYINNYLYDAAGERSVKMHGGSEGVFVNGRRSAARLNGIDFTAYVSPYMVVNPRGSYTKHFYDGSRRIASKTGNTSGTSLNPAYDTKAGEALINYASKQALLKNALKARYDTLGTVYTPPVNSFEGNGAHSGNLLYFYHPDHLGSSSLITNADGAVTQHIEYVPFGEVFIEERNNTWNTPYLFNAKELDEETGLYYYGARYYEPRTSVWLSTDPMQEKYPEWSGYVYCHNNPVRYIDPTGEFPIETIWDIGNVLYDVGAAVVNHIKGDHQAAKSNWVNLGLDAGAMLIPYVPAGASKVVKGGAAGVKALDKAADAGKAAKTVETSRAARREVMRKADIPTSQQPKSQSKNVSGREYSYDVPKEGGGTQTKSVQQQTKDISHQNQPHWEAGKVKERDGRVQENKYGRPRLENDKSKVNYNER